TAWRLIGRIRCGPWTSPTFRCPVASSIWQRWWTGSAAGFCPGGCRSAWRSIFALRRSRRRWPNTAGRRFSTPTRAASSPVPRSPACWRTMPSRSAWTARALGATTSSSSGSGARSNTRRSIFELTSASPGHALRSAGIWTFITANVHIRVLTPEPRITPTLTSCRRPRQHDFRRRCRGITPVGLRPPSATPRQRHRNGNRRRFHLSKAKRCSDEPGHLFMRVENHLLGFPRVGDDEHLAAERQPEMRNLDGLHDASQLDMLMAPIELAGFAGRKRQRNKGVREAGAGFGCLPALHKPLHAVVGTAIPLDLQSLEQSTRGTALSFGELAFGQQPGFQRLLERPQHRRRLLVPLIDRLGLGPAMLANGGPRQLQVTRDRTDALFANQMTAPDFGNHIHEQHPRFSSETAG